MLVLSIEAVISYVLEGTSSWLGATFFKWLKVQPCIKSIRSMNYEFMIKLPKFHDTVQLKRSNMNSLDMTFANSNLVELGG